MATEMEVVAGPSGMQQQQKTIKIWNSTKTKGKVVSVMGFSDLVTKVKDKFEETQRFKILCEDGCEIDDDDGLFSLGNVPLTLHNVKEGEEFEAFSQSEPAEKVRFQALMESLKRRRKGSETSARKRDSLTVRATFGWMHYNMSQKRYIAVRSQKGGGIHTQEILKTITYNEMLQTLKQNFFPCGKSVMGKMNKFHFTIGDCRGNVIETQDFKLDSSSRVYLLSKEKIFRIDTDSDSDFELPQISFTNTQATTAVIQHQQTLEPFNTNAPITTVVQPLQSNT